MLGWLAVAALTTWIAVLLLPSRPWRTREQLEPAAPFDPAGADLSRVTVLVPARNEASAIGATLRALAAQGEKLRVVVVDDESDDGTAAAAAAATSSLGPALDARVVAGQGLPAGWGGKLWALEQGLATVESEFTLLLDAEIRLAPGVIAALLDKAETGQLAMVSIMARLRCESFWERLLVPPFIFFFKLLYPFALVNDLQRSQAAAAGGCILIRTRALRDSGGFSAMRAALIDDCTLAARIKRTGQPIWLGLSHSVESLRSYTRLADFRRMVTRTAFTQLGYSSLTLLVVVALMLVLFVSPWLAIVAGPELASRLAGLIAVAAMAAAYWPVVRFYGRHAIWTLTLAPAAVLFLWMTIESALNYWRGIRAEWKGRRYATD